MSGSSPLPDAGQAPPGPGTLAGRWARRWQVLSGTAQTILVGSVVGVIALVVALLVLSRSGNKSGSGGGGGGNRTVAINGRVRAAATRSPSVTAPTIGSPGGAVTAVAHGARWVTCPRGAYFSCSIPSRSWQVSDTGEGLDVMSPARNAYAGFGILPDTYQSVVQSDVRTVLSNQGVFITSSSVSGDTTTFSGLHVRTPVRGEIIVSSVSRGVGVWIEWATARQWSALRPTLDRIHASISYHG